MGNRKVRHTASSCCVGRHWKTFPLLSVVAKWQQTACNTAVRITNAIKTSAHVGRVWGYIIVLVSVHRRMVNAVGTDVAIDVWHGLRQWPRIREPTNWRKSRLKACGLMYGEGHKQTKKVSNFHSDKADRRCRKLVCAKVECRV